MRTRSMATLICLLLAACSEPGLATGPDAASGADTAGGGADTGELAPDTAPDTTSDTANATDDGAGGGPACATDADCASLGSAPCSPTRCVNGTCQAPSGDCDDDPCTQSACVAGACTEQVDLCACDPAKKGADCAQRAGGADPCTGAWRCNPRPGVRGGTVCAFDSDRAVSCDASGDTACAKNTCQPATGTCAMTPLPDAAKVPCDDGDACTVNDLCKAGACVGLTDICPCKPGDDAACASKLGLDPTDKCGDVPTCALITTGANAGKTQCVAEPGVSCPDTGDACTVSQCQPATGACKTLPAEQAAGKSVPCDDGDSCTANDSCKGGQCVGAINLCQCTPATVAKDCPPGDGCATVATCEANLCGFAFAPPPCKSDKDTACLVNACTPGQGTCAMTAIEKTRLVCHEGGPCRRVVGGKGTTVFCDDGSACTANDQCQGGVCKSIAICPCKSAADCKDGKPCFTQVTCTKGACTVAPAKSCPAPGPCQLGSCDAKTGACTTVPAADGLPCSDGSLCLGTGKCSGGTCAVVAPLGCTDGDVCTLNTCSLDKGSFTKSCSFPLRKDTMCTHGSKLPADAAALGQVLKAGQHSVLSGSSVVAGQTHGSHRVWVSAALYNALAKKWPYEAGGDYGAVLAVQKAGAATQWLVWRQTKDPKTGKSAPWFFRSKGADPTQADAAGFGVGGIGAGGCGSCHKDATLLSGWPLK